MSMKTHFYNVEQGNVCVCSVVCVLVGSRKGTGAGEGELVGVAYSRPGSPGPPRHKQSLVQANRPTAAMLTGRDKIFGDMCNFVPGEIPPGLSLSLFPSLCLSLAEYGIIRKHWGKAIDSRCCIWYSIVSMFTTNT